MLSWSKKITYFLLDISGNLFKLEKCSYFHPVLNHQHLVQDTSLIFHYIFVVTSSNSSIKYPKLLLLDTQHSFISAR